ncbi:hypothetical protein D3C85_792850 [compost metagenome]
MQTRRDRHAIGLLSGDIFRQLQVDGSGFLFFRQTKRFTHPCRDIVCRGELVGVLGDRSHHAADVDDLKTALLGLFDGLLACNHQHRHAAQISVRAGSHQIRCTWPKGRQTDTGFTRETTISSGHEAGRLFMARQHQLDLRLAKGL